MHEFSFVNLLPRHRGIGKTKKKPKEVLVQVFKVNFYFPGNFKAAKRENIFSNSFKKKMTVVPGSSDTCLFTLSKKKIKEKWHGVSGEKNLT